MSRKIRTFFEITFGDECIQVIASDPVQAYELAKKIRPLPSLRNLHITGYRYGLKPERYL